MHSPPMNRRPRGRARGAQPLPRSRLSIMTRATREEELSTRFAGDMSLTSQATALRWPADAIPVEIFAEIMSYLPRSVVQSMRLVNKEFEKMASAHLFQVVVVPFKPELYDVSPDPPLGGYRSKSVDLAESALLPDKGMRVFCGFGERIKKFAMSFELDEEKLNYPPSKNDQEAITSFWGIYPWPHLQYNRYEQVEGLEQTADETQTMATALRYITGANELALSIDGGLGWLSGPDVNQRVLERGQKPVVFGTPKYVPEPKAAFRNGEVGGYTSFSSLFDQRYHDIRRMCQAAGYHGKDLDAAARLMVEFESSYALPDDEPFVAPPVVFRGLCTPSDHPEPDPEPSASPLLQVLNAWDNVLFDVHDEGAGQHVTTYQGTTPIGDKPRCLWTRSPVIPLKPNDLTTAQKEMLLEIEWAQRAFMQSYTIAVMDNAVSFHGVQTLKIARIPGSHLLTLHREDFWNALPSLSKLSLAIIPDWREVGKNPAGWVQDERVTPSESVALVYKLLKEQISDRENIKSLHLEWICGGEYSPGMFSRNQHVMPAPIVSNALDMVNRRECHPVLRFPHLKHLSLKNCYATPHVMTTFLLGLKRSGIQSLTFDSVSLTASVPRDRNPTPLPNQHTLAAAMAPIPTNATPQVHTIHAQWQAVQGVNAYVQFPPPPAGTTALMLAPHLIAHLPTAVAQMLSAGPNWLEDPRPGSWASIIDKLTPCRTLKEIRFTIAHGGQARASAADPPPNALTKLDFTSCGYVRLPLDFDQSYLIHPGAIKPPRPSIVKRMHDNEAHMMKANDPLLGTVINFMDPFEVAQLQNLYALSVGWLASGLTRTELRADCEEDGIMDAGGGRFDGVIVRDQSR